MAINMENNKRKQFARIAGGLMLVLLLAAGCQQSESAKMPSTAVQEEDKAARPDAEGEGETAAAQESEIGNMPADTEKVPDLVRDGTSGAGCAFGVMSEDFYFYIEEVFSIQGKDGVVVVGVNHNAAMYTGVEVDVLSLQGRQETTIDEIEVWEGGLVDAVAAESNVGILLGGLTSEQVKRGDMIVLRDCGQVSDQTEMSLILLETSAAEAEELLKEGQSIWLTLFEEPVEAVIESVSLDQEEGKVQLSVKLRESIAFVAQQTALVYGAGEKMIGLAYLSETE